MKTSVKVATIIGIPIKIDITWLVIFFLVFISLSQGYFPESAPGVNYKILYWITGFFATILFFFSILFHELSHSYVAKLFKLKISQITLFIFGGVAHLESEPDSPKTEFLMAIAGPAASITLAIIFGILSIFSSIIFYYSKIDVLNINILCKVMFNYLALINTLLGTFNLIPAYPLDGGRILRSILWYTMSDLSKATRISSSISRGFALLFMVAGIYLISKGYVLNGIWIIFIGWFLDKAAVSSYQDVTIKKFLDIVKIEKIMNKQVIIMPSDLTINQAIIKFFFEYPFLAYPVSENGSIAGIVDINMVKKLPRKSWNEAKIKDVMEKLDSRFTILPNESVATAMTKIKFNPAGKLLVMENGILKGILTKTDLLHHLEIRAQLGNV